MSIKSYRFERYVDVYTGVCAMAKANGLKLKVAYRSGHVETWLEPAGDYGDDIDSDLLDFDASRTWRKPNHMIGLGKGELKDRIVSHWYADAKGNVTQTQTFKGVDEIAQVYDYSSAEADELAKNTKKNLQDLQSEGDVKVTVHEDSGIVFDVGDTVTARIISRVSPSLRQSLRKSSRSPTASCPSITRPSNKGGHAMARIDNATVMQCDRCGRNKWYKDTTDPDIKTWYNTIRLDADGKEHGYLFCTNCWQEYANRLKDIDNGFDSWYQNGGKQNG